MSCVSAHSHSHRSADEGKRCLLAPSVCRVELVFALIFLLLNGGKYYAQGREPRCKISKGARCSSSATCFSLVSVPYGVQWSQAKIECHTTCHRSRPSIQLKALVLLRSSTWRVYCKRGVLVITSCQGQGGVRIITMIETCSARPPDDHLLLVTVAVRERRPLTH